MFWLYRYKGFSRTAARTVHTAVVLAVKLHEAIVSNRPDSWRGNAAKENTVKGAIFGVLQNFDEVLRLFPIVCQQQEY